MSPADARVQEAEAGRIVVERVSREKIRLTNSSADKPETDLGMLTRVVGQLHSSKPFAAERMANCTFALCL